MADFICSAVQQCLQPAFDFLAARADYITKLDDNLDKLKLALLDLSAIKHDLMRNVRAQENKGRQRLDEVERWRSKVETAETKTNMLVSEASVIRQRLSTYGYCSNNIISAYGCGKEIAEMLDEVKILLSEKVSEVYTRQATLPVVVEEPVQLTFGLDTKFQSTWSLLMKDDTRMLGLYGMGGVGKTTILTLMCNKFVEVKGDFDVVIWVKVSKDVDTGRIQDDIGKRLGLYDEEWCNKEETEKHSDIYRVLKLTKPRFVLLLDNLWEEVSLSAIGIPLMGKEYKIVFTTRFKGVCGAMGANKEVEVECLAEKDAWDLFKLKARCGGFNEEISHIAKKIAANCHGLPLALEVIGKAMSSKTTLAKWRHALDTLESCPSDLRGTENSLFRVLKLSYDYLEKENAQLCFLYCALFPKASYIRKDKLIEYWIAEGFIDERDGRQRAKARGHDTIDLLVEASLLLNDSESEQKVYMHNVIREMAFWIVVGSGDKYVVEAGAGLSKLPEIKNWKAVTKMSLMNNDIKSIPDCPRLPNPDRLVTLFLQNNKLVDIVGKFFQVLSTLVVLDLSGNGITTLPDNLLMLVSLRYLNLLGTRIKNLQGLKDLIELIHLDLESTSNLGSISLISGLLKLQVLRFYHSNASLDLSLLENLERLEDLQVLTITVKEADVLKAFLGSNLAGKTKGLYLEGFEISGELFAATFGALGSLSKLGMEECDIIESETHWEDSRRHLRDAPSTSSSQIIPSNTWFRNLSAVELLSCVHLKDVTWLIYAAELESLHVETSPKMEKLISKKKAAGIDVKQPFLKLQILRLEYLDELESIYWTSLSFPRLQKVSITKCPKLRKLPFNSTSVERIDALHIEVDEGWSNGLEWESEAAQERFRDAFHTAHVS